MNTLPHSSSQTLLEGWPSVIEIPVLWGDMDALGHVNNVVYFRFFESGRMDYFYQIGFDKPMQNHQVGPILASTQCRFRLPLTFPDTVSIATKIKTIEDDRFVHLYRVVSHRHQKIAAEGEGLVVSFDYKAQRKIPLPKAIRQNIFALQPSLQPT